MVNNIGPHMLRRPIIATYGYITSDYRSLLASAMHTLMLSTTEVFLYSQMVPTMARISITTMRRRRMPTVIRWLVGMSGKISNKTK